MTQKELNLINETINNAISNSNAEIMKELKAMHKDIKALSKDNAVNVKAEATKKASKATSKSAKTEKPEKVTRCYITATKRLEGATFSKVYALVKKHNGKIKNTDARDSKGNRLACWTFSESDGKAFAKAIVDSKIWKSVKAIPLKSEIVEVATK